MIDLNRAERKAIWVAAVLVTGGLAGRGLLSPAPTEVTWDSSPVQAMATEVAGAIDEQRRASRPIASGEKIDVNTAPEVELRRLPGVGPSLARAIVAERDRAPISSAQDLQRVRGIGPARAETLEPLLDFAPGGEPGWASAVATGAGQSPAPGLQPALRPGGRCPPGTVDPNSADAGQLEELPGVGPAIAVRIIEYRDRHGPFRSAEDLQGVSGIGPKTLEKMAGQLCAG